MQSLSYTKILHQIFNHALRQYNPTPHEERAIVDTIAQYKQVELLTYIYSTPMQRTFFISSIGGTRNNYFSHLQHMQSEPF